MYTPRTCSEPTASHKLVERPWRPPRLSCSPPRCPASFDPSTGADVVLVRRAVLVVYRFGELHSLSVVSTVTQSLVRRLAVGLDLEVCDLPRSVAHKPWNELVVHVKLDRVHYLLSRPRCATLLCDLLVCSLDAASTRGGANRCVEKHCVMLPVVAHQLCQVLDGLFLIRQENDARPDREAQCRSGDRNRAYSSSPSVTVAENTASDRAHLQHIKAWVLPVRFQCLGRGRSSPCPLVGRFLDHAWMDARPRVPCLGHSGRTCCGTGGG